MRILISSPSDEQCDLGQILKGSFFKYSFCRQESRSGLGEFWLKVVLKATVKMLVSADI